MNKMNENVNYQQKLDSILNNIKKEGDRPRLFLHVCCAPCSSYVLEYLTAYFDITVLYYNPNIAPKEEYEKRTEELKRFLSQVYNDRVRLLEGEYHPEDFYEAVKGMEQMKEGSERCRRCYRLRLGETARLAKVGDFDYFTTTLSISPYKNARWLNEIGMELAEEYGVSYLFSDFKKRDGYRRSIQLSAEYGLYRQDYCGCVFSKMERELKFTGTDTMNGNLQEQAP